VAGAGPRASPEANGFTALAPHGVEGVDCLNGVEAGETGEEAVGAVEFPDKFRVSED
jgi:hypothetical protein